MANLRLPGPLCQFLDALHIDSGTMCRASAPVPGVITGQPAPAGPLKKHGASRRKRKTVPRGNMTSLTKVDFEEAARSLGEGIPAALVQAFAEVESGGRSGFGPDGRPKIAFEGHVFRKLTGKTFDKDYPLLSYRYIKKAGPEWQSNNRNHATAWKTIEEAAALDHEAAFQSCSWGMFQVMGFNYGSCGYKNVDDFVQAMKAGEKGQLKAFVGFCKSAHGMTTAMRSRDFSQMATLYNGSDYGDYDLRIEHAYKRHGGD